MLNDQKFGPPCAFGKLGSVVLIQFQSALLANANHLPVSRPPSRRQQFASDRGRPRKESSELSVARASVDKAFRRSYADLMNLQVPPELEARLTRLAAETGRTVDQVALDLLESSVDHDEWFRREVEKGRASARQGRLLEHDEVASRMDKRYPG
jgi:predicted transcriptional regulator